MEKGSCSMSREDLMDSTEDGPLDGFFIELGNSGERDMKMPDFVQGAFWEPWVTTPSSYSSDVTCPPAEEKGDGSQLDNREPLPASSMDQEEWLTYLNDEESLSHPESLPDPSAQEEVVGNGTISTLLLEEQVVGTGTSPTREEEEVGNGSLSTVIPEEEAAGDGTLPTQSLEEMEGAVTSEVSPTPSMEDVDGVAELPVGLTATSDKEEEVDEEVDALEEEELVEVNVNPIGYNMATVITEHQIGHESHEIARSIVGKKHYEEMGANGTLSIMVSTICESLQKMKDNNVHITMEIARKEACRWVYPYMKSTQQNVICHPPCIREIPSIWRAGSNQELYLPPEGITAIEAWGLDKTQVTNLLNNDRKRVVKKDPEAQQNLKSYFSESVTQILSDWKILNPGKHPNSEEKKRLSAETRKNVLQIQNWFYNHGRDRSKKRPKET